MTEKTDVTVMTNAESGYNLMISLAGNTATGSAVLDGTTDTGNTITSTTADRVDEENNFTFALNSGSTGTGTNFLNTSTQVSGAGTSAPTNSYLDSIYYFLNIDYTTPSDTYLGTVTYTAVGQF